jgi:mono/diheme cytochrome c family protein
VNMTRVLPVAAVVAISAASLLHPTPARGSASAAAPAVAGAYTAAQAAAGEKIYAANCSACHGADLTGGQWPSLVGDAFTSQFIGMSAGDVYYVMSTQMPVGAPGSLKPNEYLALLAYILQQNKYPKGTAPLTQAKAKSIEITSLRARQG